MNTWHRGLRLIDNMIDLLQLDLSGKTILTEVGSNAFLFTPIIALKANAGKVYAWCKDTRYGTSADIIRECKELIRYAGIDESRISFNSTGIEQTHIEAADIITNSGFLRPLDKDKLQYCKEGTAIPIMYEKWELRQSDIDIEYCKMRNLKVAGTWENYPGLNIFDYCEQLIVKLAFDAGMEISGNKIIIWSNDHFGEMAEAGFQKMKAGKIVRTTSIDTLYQNIADADFVFFCDYTLQDILWGENGIIDPNIVATKNPSVTFVHLAGKIDPSYMSSAIRIYPDQKGDSHRMTYTLSYLGIEPAIRLIAAGLKVGELLSGGNYSNHKLVQPIV